MWPIGSNSRGLAVVLVLPWATDRGREGTQGAAQTSEAQTGAVLYGNFKIRTLYRVCRCHEELKQIPVLSCRPF